MLTAFYPTLQTTKAYLLSTNHIIIHNFSNSSTYHRRSTSTKVHFNTNNLQPNLYKLLIQPWLTQYLKFHFLIPSHKNRTVAVAINTHSLSGRRHSGFQSCVSLLSLSISTSVAIERVVTITCLVNQRSTLHSIQGTSSPTQAIGHHLVRNNPSSYIFGHNCRTNTNVISSRVSTLVHSIRTLDNSSTIFSVLERPSIDKNSR